MIDPFVLLAPVLLLAVVALLQFVGCDKLFGIAPVETVPGLTFDPPPGTYPTGQMVTLSSGPGATIYYTTDGTIPPAGNSQVYSGPISVSYDTIINTLLDIDGAQGYASGVYKILPIMYRQRAENDETLNNNAVTTAGFINDVTAGNVMVVWVWYLSPTDSVATVGDTAGNTYQRAVGPTPGTGTLATRQQEIWYANLINGGTGQNFKVTATFAGTFNAEKAISAHEYSGADPMDPLAPDVAPSALTGSNANASVGSGMATAARLIFGAAVFKGAGSAGQGFAQRSSLAGNVTEDQQITMSGPVAATFTNPAQDWIAQMVPFK